MDADWLGYYWLKMPYGSGFWFSSWATAKSAANNGSGNCFPLFSARRRIPAQAFGLKKNLCGRGPVSKVSDNEHTTASLGHSEVLSVKDSVCEPIPEFSHRPEEGTKVPSTIATEDTRHVFPYEPSGLKVVKNAAIDEGEIPSGIFKPFA